MNFPFKDWLGVVEGQRLIITEPKITELTTTGQLERYRYPAYRTQIRQKVRCASKRGTNTVLREIRGK